MTRFGRVVTAIIAGNAIYFGIAPYLPVQARHRSFDFDFGLLVDVVICLIVYGALGLLFRGRIP